MARFKHLNGGTPVTTRSLVEFENLWKDRERWFYDFYIETRQNIQNGMARFSEDDYDIGTCWEELRGLSDVKWAYMQTEYDKFYYEDYLGRTIEVEWDAEGRGKTQTSGFGTEIFNLLHEAETMDEITPLIEKFTKEQGEVDFIIVKG